jgi:hypothetical protein
MLLFCLPEDHPNSYFPKYFPAYMYCAPVSLKSTACCSVTTNFISPARKFLTTPVNHKFPRYTRLQVSHTLHLRSFYYFIGRIIPKLLNSWKSTSWLSLLWIVTFQLRINGREVSSHFHFIHYSCNNFFSVVFSQRANYTDWVTATCRRNLVPTFVDRGVSRGQRSGSPTVFNPVF